MVIVIDDDDEEGGTNKWKKKLEKTRNDVDNENGGDGEGVWCWFVFRVEGKMIENRKEWKNVFRWLS